MKVENFIHILAGTMVLIGTALGAFVNPWWLILPAFAGFNLIQSTITGFCPPSLILKKLGWLDANGVIRPGGAR